MNTVFLLLHTNPETEDEILIGVYSRKENAEKTIEKLRPKRGYSQHPDAFEICDYTLDQDHWTEGFVLE